MKRAFTFFAVGQLLTQSGRSESHPGEGEALRFRQIPDLETYPASFSFLRFQEEIVWLHHGLTGRATSSCRSSRVRSRCTRLLVNLKKHASIRSIVDDKGGEKFFKEHTALASEEGDGGVGQSHTRSQGRSLRSRRVQRRIRVGLTQTRKAEGCRPYLDAPEEEPEPTNVINLMDALRESMKRKKTSNSARSTNRKKSVRSTTQRKTPRRKAG